VQLLEFFDLVLPAAGKVVLAQRVTRTDPVGSPYNTFLHTVVPQHAAALPVIDSWSVGQRDVYYALAAYRQGLHLDAKGKRVVRVRDNVEALRALWFDIDFKGNYPDIKTAALALRAFSQATGMPAPSILVGSGNGIHTYWPLDADLPLDRWQPLADALKACAKDKGLDIDPVCTADACRVLRPPGTVNWKDPNSPKPVKILYSTAKQHTYADLEAVLLPWFGTPKTYNSTAKQRLAVNDELSANVGAAAAPSKFANIVVHCGVAQHILNTRGKDCTEPEWVAMLQLLRHCTDGEDFVHVVSDGHPGYQPGATDAKWQQRSVTAGPTLCSTFDQYESSICAKCPHRGAIKSPIMVGMDDTMPVIGGMPPTYRVAPDGRGTERLFLDANNQKQWVKILRHTVSNLRVMRSIATGEHQLTFDVKVQDSKPYTLQLPSSALGNSRMLTETLAKYAFVLKDKEAIAFKDLMATWLERLQTNRRVADVTDQLGWLIEKKDEGEVITGFAAGPAVFYADGRVREDVKPAREFASVAVHYEPKGSLDAWKTVSSFLTDQDNPAFTAAIAAAFAAPLLRFTGHNGAILSLVSTASGVGKSSALKCAQGVWGSPKHGINAVDDTPKSVARKVAFLNNLPAFWDELRGRKTLEDFLTLAFQITQGKDRTRLDSSAQLREVHTWETMMVVASNESIFEAMSRHSAGSDAGAVRVFEMTIDPVASDRNRAELAIMFESLNSNYGHAGRIYSQYLAQHAGDVEAKVKDIYTKIAKQGTMAAQERFWFAIAAALMTGAIVANQLQLTKINLSTLLNYLMKNIDRLRGRTTNAMDSSDPSTLVAGYLAAHQDRGLVVQTFPATRQNTKGYLPTFPTGVPKSNKISYHLELDSNTVRLPKAEFERWLEFRQMPVYSTMQKLRNDYGMIQRRSVLGIGTSYALTSQIVLELQLNNMQADRARSDDSLNPADSPDSLPLSVPEG
jgi:hypothetical protein